MYLCGGQGRRVIDYYAWRGVREAMLRFGPENPAPVLVLPPLFEEANRTRFFLVEIMRGLVLRGIATMLPDLPGTNDSPVATVDARFADWQAAIATLPAPVATISLRGGALLDTTAATDLHWRFAPETGARLLRDMIRSTAMTSSLKPSEVETAARTNPSVLGGNEIHPELFVALEAALPSSAGNIRNVRLEDDPGEADIRVAGTPLWRRAEPDHDAALAEALVADIAAWLA
jgi:hypothetical protein